MRCVRMKQNKWEYTLTILDEMQCWNTRTELCYLIEEHGYAWLLSRIAHWEERASWIFTQHHRIIWLLLHNYVWKVWWSMIARSWINWREPMTARMTVQQSESRSLNNQQNWIHKFTIHNSRIDDAIDATVRNRSLAGRFRRSQRMNIALRLCR